MTEKAHSNGRQSNFELMRIISMLMIILGHCWAQSGFSDHMMGINHYLGGLLCSGARIAVNMFLLLGAWFMVDTKFKPRRITALYFHTWVITAPLTIILLLCGFHPSFKEIARSFMPFLGKGLWYVSAYLALIMLTPWLSKALLLPRKSHRNLTIVLFSLISVWVTLYSFDRMEDQWADCLVWFSFCYIFIGYYKRYCFQTFTLNKYMVLFVGFCTYACIALVNQYYLPHSNYWLHNVFYAFVSDYKTVPNFFIAMCFFYFFQHLNLGVNRVINYIATGAFTAYIVHQTPTFIPVLWYDIYRCQYFWHSKYQLFYMLFVVFSVYGVSLLIEEVRRRYIERYILNTSLVGFIEKILGRFYAGI